MHTVALCWVPVSGLVRPVFAEDLLFMPDLDSFPLVGSLCYGRAYRIVPRTFALAHDLEAYVEALVDASGKIRSVTQEGRAVANAVLMVNEDQGNGRTYNRQIGISIGSRLQSAHMDWLQGVFPRQVLFNPVAAARDRMSTAAFPYYGG